MLFFALLLPPLLGAALAAIVRPYRPLVGRVNAALALAPLGAALGFGTAALAGDPAQTFGPGAVLRIDSLSALLAICVSGAAALALLLSPGLERSSRYDATRLRRYHMIVNLLVFTMLLAVAANNVGVLWIAIEATTITSALLLPLTLTPASVEASWKYLLIGSVGIALAFVGTVLSYVDFVTLVGRSEHALNWTVLREAAPSLHPEVMRLAFAFLLVGYGTKAGIAPMHAWKPDAYGEAPAPLGAIMSSALFAVAIYAIMRWKAIIDAVAGPAYADTLLIALGLISLVIAAFSLVLVRYVKRMLAYSSIEHTGLICLGLGLGPLGLAAALLHLVNHTAAKALLFFLVERVERMYGTTRIAEIGGLGRAMPWTAGLFTAALFALIGLPPFGIFLSEYALFRAGFAQGYAWLMIGVLLLLLIAFAAIISHVNRMLYGPVSPGVVAVQSAGWQLVPLALSLLVLVVLGLALPAPLTDLIGRSVEVLTP
ncbi:MAG: hydrogenase [Chloroflexales bacterium]|nr:hydrogenase [Chloroflexales bacterium]